MHRSTSQPPPFPLRPSPYFLAVMSFARRLLLRASRSTWLARQLSERAFLRRAVRRFLAWEEPSAAIPATGRPCPAGRFSCLILRRDRAPSLQAWFPGSFLTLSGLGKRSLWLPSPAI